MSIVELALILVVAIVSLVAIRAIEELRRLRFMTEYLGGVISCDQRYMGHDKLVDEMCDRYLTVIKGNRVLNSSDFREKVGLTPSQERSRLDETKTVPRQ